MMLNRLIFIAVMVLPALVMATAAKNITTSVLSALGAGMLSPFETAMAMSVPYLVLVYCVIYRPIVRFLDTLQGKTPPNQPPSGGE